LVQLAGRASARSVRGARPVPVARACRNTGDRSARPIVLLRAMAMATCVWMSTSAVLAAPNPDSGATERTGSGADARKSGTAASAGDPSAPASGTGAMAAKNDARVAIVGYIRTRAANEPVPDDDERLQAGRLANVRVRVSFDN